MAPEYQRQRDLPLEFNVWDTEMPIIKDTQPAAPISSIGTPSTWQQAIQRAKRTVTYRPGDGQPLGVDQRLFSRKPAIDAVRNMLKD